MRKHILKQYFTFKIFFNHILFYISKNNALFLYNNVLHLLQIK